MKLFILLILGLIAFNSGAQTNSIIFPQLLSPTNSVLMTNAEFRCFSGNKIFFKNGDGYKSFRAPELNTNVLFALHVSAASLELQEELLQQKNANYKAWYANQLAAQKTFLAAQKKQQLLQEQAAREEQVQWLQYEATHGRTGWDGNEYHDNQSTGNFIGN